MIETINDLRKEIDTIVRHYFVAALWSSVNHDEYEEDDEIHFDQDYDADDFPPEEWERARKIVRHFIEKHSDDLIVFAKSLGTPQIGHDLWLTRCGHGAGFWDRNLEDRSLSQEMLDRLSNTCRDEYGEAHVFVVAKKLMIE